MRRGYVRCRLAEGVVPGAGGLHGRPLVPRAPAHGWCLLQWAPLTPACPSFFPPGTDYKLRMKFALPQLEQLDDSPVA